MIDTAEKLDAQRAQKAVILGAWTALEDDLDKGYRDTGPTRPAARRARFLPASARRARALLSSWLATGPAEARTILALGQRAGLSRDQLKRAKLALGVRSFKPTRDGGWVWEIPQSARTGKEN